MPIMRITLLVVLAFAVCGKVFVAAADCPKPVCLGVGGDCKPDGAECGMGLSYNYTETTCTCIATKSKKGDVCTLGGGGGGSCDGVFGCAKVAGTNDTYKCYNWGGTLGETCADDFDCKPPRTCTAGVCSTTLQVGDSCTYNDVCPLGSSCGLTADQASDAQMKCYAPLTVNIACKKGDTAPYQPCGPGLLCGKASEAAAGSTCLMQRSIAVGSWASDSDLCITWYRNSTTGNCALSPFPNYLGNINKACTTDADCIVSQGDQIECHCGFQDTTNTKSCQLKGSIVNAGLQMELNLLSVGGKCENDEFRGTLPADGSCLKRFAGGFDFKSIACKYYDIIKTTKNIDDLGICNFGQLTTTCAATSDPIDVTLKVNGLPGYTGDGKWQTGFAAMIAAAAGLPPGRVEVKLSTLDANAKGTIILSISGSGYPSALVLGKQLKDQIADSNSAVSVFFGASVTGATLPVPSSAAAFGPFLGALVLMFVASALNL